MVEFTQEEAKKLEENINKRIGKAYRIIRFSISIKNIGNFCISPQNFKDLIFIILGHDHIRRDLRRYLKQNRFWEEEEQ